MYIFATLKHIGTFKKVCFYSIKLEKSDLSLYEEFYEKYSNIDELKDEMDTLFSQIKAIGNRGALSHYFRHEGSAEALPTWALGDGEAQLRLYCIRLTTEVVILLNGGVKTKQKAQDCPNVATYFHTANKLSKIMTQLLMEKELEIDLKLRPSAASS